jgi:hypothetical protein
MNTVLKFLQLTRLATDIKISSVSVVSVSESTDTDTVFYLYVPNSLIFVFVYGKLCPKIKSSAEQSDKFYILVLYDMYIHDIEA